MKFIRSFLVRRMPAVFARKLKRIYYPWLLRRFPEEKWPFSPIVKRLLKPGDCVVDAGANVGYVTRLLSRWVTPSGFVNSFEPVPETFEWLAECVRKLRLDNVRLFNCGLSSAARSAVMGIPRYASGGENLYESRVVEEGQGQRFSRTVEVNLRALDDVMKGAGRPVSFIKIDVEGHEWQAMQGGRGVIARDKPALLIEVRDNPDQPGSDAWHLFNLLSGMGYRSFLLETGRLIERRAGDQAGDFFFLQPHHTEAVRDWIHVRGSPDRSPLSTSSQ